MIPKVGETVFGFQHCDNFVGETMFLASAQEHSTSDYNTGLAEALEEVCRTGEMQLIDGSYIETINTDDKKNLIVWEMTRIR